MARPKKDKLPELTPMQRRFVKEYFVDFEGKAAAIRAGYSPTIASAQASKMLKQPHIAEALAKETKKKEYEIDIDANRTLLELARISYFDPRQVLEWETIAAAEDGEPSDDDDEGGKKVRVGDFMLRIKDAKDLSDDAAAAIKEFKIDDKGITVKFHDKLRALEVLAKFHNLVRPADHINIFNQLGVMNESQLDELEREVLKRLGTQSAQGHVIEGEAQEINGKLPQHIRALAETS